MNKPVAQDIYPDREYYEYGIARLGYADQYHVISRDQRHDVMERTFARMREVHPEWDIIMVRRKIQQSAFQPHGARNG